MREVHSQHSTFQVVPTRQIVSIQDKNIKKQNNTERERGREGEGDKKSKKGLSVEKRKTGINGSFAKK